MRKDSKLLEMLAGYAAAHQHPLNIAVHLVGIPTIMLGVFIPLTWVSFEIGGITIDLAQVVLVAMFGFYLTLDVPFAVVFLVASYFIALLAAYLGDLPSGTAITIASAAFFGGYLAQFIGHAVERSVPVILRHPVQANLAAPFFTVVEVCKLLGLRESLFNEVQEKIASMRREEADA